MYYFWINDFWPANTEPTGAPRLLLRQNVTESQCLTMRPTGTPRRTAALNTLAPSMCKGTSISLTSLPSWNTCAFTYDEMFKLLKFVLQSRNHTAFYVYFQWFTIVDFSSSALDEKNVNSLLSNTKVKLLLLFNISRKTTVRTFACVLKKVCEWDENTKLLWRKTYMFIVSKLKITVDNLCGIDIFKTKKRKLRYPYARWFTHRVFPIDFGLGVNRSSFSTTADG